LVTGGAGSARSPVTVRGVYIEAAAKTQSKLDPSSPHATRVAHEMRALRRVVVGATVEALAKAFTGSPAGAPLGSAVGTRE